MAEREIERLLIDDGEHIWTARRSDKPHRHHWVGSVEKANRPGEAREVRTRDYGFPDPLPPVEFVLLANRHMPAKEG